MLQLMVLKYVTANVMDSTTGWIVAMASTVDLSIKNPIECGRINEKAAIVVSEVLAMWLKVKCFLVRPRKRNSCRCQQKERENIY
ncbi:putative ribosomal protein L18 [Helianthus anomalus]